MRAVEYVDLLIEFDRFDLSLGHSLVRLCFKLAVDLFQPFPFSTSIGVPLCFGYRIESQVRGSLIRSTNTDQSRAVLFSGPGRLWDWRFISETSQTFTIVATISRRKSPGQRVVLHGISGQTNIPADHTERERQKTTSAGDSTDRVRGTWPPRRLCCLLCALTLKSLRNRVGKAGR